MILLSLLNKSSCWWALIFLIFFLHNLIMSLYSSRVFDFYQDMKPLFLLEKVSVKPGWSCFPLPHPLEHINRLLCAFRTSVLKNVNPCWTLLPFRTLFQEWLSNRSLNRPKSAHWKSKVSADCSPCFSRNENFIILQFLCLRQPPTSNISSEAPSLIFSLINHVRQLSATNSRSFLSTILYFQQMELAVLHESNCIISCSPLAYWFCGKRGNDAEPALLSNRQNTAIISVLFWLQELITTLYGLLREKLIPSQPDLV